MPEVFTSKWHVQGLRPAICEKPACQVYEIFDAMAVDPNATLVVAAIPFKCKGHATATNAGAGTLRWMDGNFKNLADYIDYQKQYFFYINNQEWQTRVANGDIPRPWNRPSMTPEAILRAQVMPTVNFRGKSIPLSNWGTEPPTTGTVTSPSLAEVTDLERIYDWVMMHDDWASQTYAMMTAEKFGFLREFAITTWVGVGDSRVLHINSGDQLNKVEQTRVQDSADIQFGPGKVTVTG